MPLQIKILVTLIIVIMFYKIVYNVFYKPVVDLHNITLEYRTQYYSLERDIKLSTKKDSIENMETVMKNIKDKHNVILDLYPNNVINIILKIKKL